MEFKVENSIVTIMIPIEDFLVLNSVLSQGVDRLHSNARFMESKGMDNAKSTRQEADKANEIVTAMQKAIRKWKGYENKSVS